MEPEGTNRQTRLHPGASSRRPQLVLGARPWSAEERISVTRRVAAGDLAARTKDDLIARCEHGRAALRSSYTTQGGEWRICAGDIGSSGDVLFWGPPCPGHGVLWDSGPPPPNLLVECECPCGCGWYGRLDDTMITNGCTYCPACRVFWPVMRRG